MNFLAHIYLSGDSKELIIGNFIADFVKGSRFGELPEGVVNGIRLHRKIDSFTDSHPIVRMSNQRLSGKYRKYSPVITDIFYDHLLAASWDSYSDKPLAGFAEDFYKLAGDNRQFLPEKARYMLPYMISHNWLVSYSQIEGIQRALTGLSRRTTFVSGMERATEDLLLHYESFKNEFREFFAELREYTGNQAELQDGR